MPRSPRLRRLLFLCALSAGALSPGVARAASITIPSVPVRSLPLPASIPGYQNTWINFSDCVNDLHITVPLTLDSDALTQPGYDIEVWAGQNCDQAASRTAPGQATQTCWQVPANGQLALPRSQNPSVSIAARDIIAQYSATPKVAYGGPYGADVCTSFAAGQPSINVYFMVIAPDKSAPANAQLAFTVDLVGPPAPTGVSAGIADGALIVNWTPTSDTSGATQGYTVYCDPPPVGNSISDASPDTGLTTSTDAGTHLVCADGGFTDGGVDDSGDALPGTPIDGGCSAVANASDSGVTGAGITSCPSSVLVSGGGTVTVDEAGTASSVGGVQKFIDPGYICGQALSATTSSVNTKALVNGQYYTVAVAGIDSFGNTGPLGIPACSTPSPVTDFWSTYRGDGGLAGGGFCSVKDLGVPATTTPLLVLSLWGLAAAIRRRRTRKGNDS